MESTVTKGGQREYNVTAPLVDGNEVLGYIHVTFTLDDVAQTTKASLYRRMAVTLMIFSFGMLVSLYLARKYTQPLHDVVKAAKHVAAGDLTKTIEVEGEDEIAELTRSFTKMVEKFRRHSEPEARPLRAARPTDDGSRTSDIA